MDLSVRQQDLLGEYLSPFGVLIGDKRTGTTFREIVQGIINAGSLVCQRIAAHSPVLSEAKDGSQRVIRLVKGKSTKRSELDAQHLIARLCARGVEQLAQSEVDELWVIADGSELRKPYAKEMPALMQVRDLRGKLVPGYRTLNVLGVTPQRRGILYHRLFSSQAEDFISEPLEVQQALKTVSQALEPLKERMTVSWILDSGFDDVAVWRTIWQQEEHLVCRIYHIERLVTYQEATGKWVAGDVQAACQHLRLVARAETRMVVRRGSQKKAKRQRIPVEIRTCPVQLTYDANVRQAGPSEVQQKQLWLVEVRLPGTHLEPWLLITDWSVEDAENAIRIFRMYRQRWAVEDSFKFTKQTLGWEEVQLLDLRGVRTLVALGWVAAGFLYELGVTLEWEEVQLLARLGGWVPRKDRKPGKITLVRGLRRLIDMLATQSFLERYTAEHDHLPARIAALLGRRAPEEL
jgi:hypothetical protein